MAKRISVWWIIIFGLCFMFSTVVVFFKSKKIDADSRIQVVCSTFPLYDWATHIIGDDSDTIILSMTEKNGINYHQFAPTDIEARQIENCQLFVCIGTEEKLMPIAEKSSGRILNLGDIARIQNPSLFAKDNTHIWLSIKNAMYFTKMIAAEIIKLDYPNKEKYEKNLQRYLNQLESIDKEYEEAVNQENIKSLILCDKNPFLWLFEDYDVKYYSALPECNVNFVESGSLEKFVKTDTVNFLTAKMDECNSKVLFKLDNSTDKFAYQVIKDSKNPLGDIFALDTMHATTLSEALKGKSYVKVMRSNLEVIKKAL